MTSSLLGARQALAGFRILPLEASEVSESAQSCFLPYTNPEAVTHPSLRHHSWPWIATSGRRMLPPLRTPPGSTRGLAPGRGRRFRASPIPHPKHPPARAERSGRLSSLRAPIGFSPTSQLAFAHSSCALLLRPPRG